MPKAAIKITSFAAALLLSAITLATFFVLRNYGPENAIERFHDAAVNGDVVEIARVTSQTPDSLSVRELVTEVYNLRRAGASPDVEDVKRSPNQVVVWIAYRIPGELREVDIRWVVKLGPASNWLIDAQETLSSSQWSP